MNVMKWIMAAMMVAGTTQAVNKTWVGNVDTNFSTDANWNPATTISNNTPVFGVAGSSGTILNNDLPAASIIAGFIFGADAESYTLDGNSIRLNGQINASATTNDQVVNFDIDINQGGSGVLRNLAGSTNALTTFNGSFTGTGGLQFLAVTDRSSGGFVLAGDNTYNGKTQVNGNGTVGATVVAAHNNALGTPAVADANDYTTVGNTGSLQFRNNITVAETISINGKGVNGALGALRNLSETNTLTGTVTFNGNSTIYSVGGLLVFGQTNGVAIDGQNNNIDLRGNSDIQIDGVIAGTGSYLAKSDLGTLSLFGLNTFSNRMRCYKGTVVANTIADAGVASSLGTGENNPVIWLGFTDNVGTTLRYVGAAASTDRQFQIGGTGSGTGGGVIESSGTGALTFTAAEFNTPLSGVATNRTLTLGGSNTGSNTIFGIILDNDTASNGVISLVKEGDGMWILPGSNAYTGATSIDAGTLLISDANALGSLDAGTTVGNNGFLWLSGGIGLDEELTVLGTVKNADGNNGIESDIVASTAVIRSDAGTLTINGNIDTATKQLDLRGFSDVVVNGVISGSGGSYLAHGDTGTLSLLAPNTFDNQMRVDRGVVVANTMADTGVACSLGVGAEIRLGWQGNDGGTLRYTGAAASTDRQIIVGTANADAGHTGSGTIENDGSGALTFTAAAFNIPQTNVIAPRTITLGGSNTGDNAVQGVLADNNTTNGAPIGLIKDGAGKWIISGANTFSGGTGVSNGTLVANADGALGTNDVTVSTGATLVLQGGTLHNYIGDAADVIVGSGASLNLNFSGTDTVGTLSINGGVSFLSPGTYSAATLGASGSGSLQVTSSGVGSGGYAEWAGLWGEDLSDPNADFDNDGLLNIYEYGLGGNPTNGVVDGETPTFGIQNVGGTNYFGYIHPQLKDPASGITYKLALTTDLINIPWATNSGYVVLGTYVAPSGDFDYVTNVTTTVEGKKFIRLIIE